jgi:hypothetical protein
MTFIPNASRLEVLLKQYLADPSGGPAGGASALYAELEKLYDWWRESLGMFSPESAEGILFERIGAAIGNIGDPYDRPDPEKEVGSVTALVQQIIECLEAGPLLAIGRRKASSMRELNADKVAQAKERARHLQLFVNAMHRKHHNLDDGALRAAAVSEAMKFPLSRKQAKRYADSLTYPK